jgi:hypothetical protein
MAAHVSERVKTSRSKGVERWSRSVLAALVGALLADCGIWR